MCYTEHKAAWLYYVTKDLDISIIVFLHYLIFALSINNIDTNKLLRAFSLILLSNFHISYLILTQPKKIG